MLLHFFAPSFNATTFCVAHTALFSHLFQDRLLFAREEKNAAIIRSIVVKCA